MKIGTGAYRDKARFWKKKPGARDAVDLRDAAVAEALEVLRAHNGRRGRGHSLEEVRKAAYNAATNAIARLTNPKKAQSLAFGSVKTVSDSQAEKPRPHGNDPSASRASRRARGVDTRMNNDLDLQEVRNQAKAAHWLAYERLPSQLQEALDSGPDRHTKGKNAARAAEQQRLHKEAQEAYSRNLTEAWEDDGAREAILRRVRDEEVRASSGVPMENMRRIKHAALRRRSMFKFPTTNRNWLLDEIRDQFLQLPGERVLFVDPKWLKRAAERFGSAGSFVWRSLIPRAD